MSVNIVMFNEDQKKRYIEYEGKNTQTLTTYFKRIAEKEREYDKDILLMNAEEIKDVVLSLGIRREEGRRHLLSLLRGYVNWGILNNVIEHSDIFQVTAENTSSQETVRRKMIKDPEDLKAILNTTLDFVDYESRSNRTALLFWLLYAGISIEELYKIKKDRLNESKKLVILESGEEYAVDDNVLSLWKYCADATHLERKRGGRAQTDEYTYVQMVESNLLFRREDRARLEKGNHRKPTYLENIIATTITSYSENKQKKYQIPPRNIIASGIFYKFLCMEREGKIVTPHIVANHFHIPYDDNNILQKTLKLRTDYDDWKIAFEH